MYYSVTTAEHVGGRKLLLRFADGSSGVVDFSKYIRRGGVFRALADPKTFKSFEINRDFGVVSWGDMDIAPETLYAEAHREGKVRARKPAFAVAETRAEYRTRRGKPQ
jgi:hypothetical protein